MQDGAPQVGRVTDLLGPIADAAQLAREIAEPLEQSAPIAFETAMAQCEPEGAQRGCRAYHAVWQYLRMADVIRAVRVDGPLFAAAVAAQAARAPLRRILISGTADYSMLAYLSHAAARAGVSPVFDVIDQCTTALTMNEWFGARRGIAVRTVLTDVTAYRPTERYDLIATHSFLYWANAEQRTQLFRNWRDWLAPEGRLCFSNRIESIAPSPGAPPPVGHTGEMVSKFLRRRAELGIALPVPEPEFEALVRTYATPMLVVRDLTMPALQRNFDESGLLVECALPVTKMVSGHGDINSAPISIEGRPRIWFQARRA